MPDRHTGTAVTKFHDERDNLVSTGGGLVAVGLRSRDPVVEMSVVPRRATVVLGAGLALAAVLRLAGNDSAWLAPLVSGAVIVCASALIVTGRQVGLPDERMTSLVVDLGRLRDAQSFERRLGGAVGDPGFRLYYRLRSSGSWLDASGTRTAPITDAGQGFELVEGPSGAAAAIVYAEDALREPRLRSAVLGAVAIAPIIASLTALTAWRAEANA